MLITERAGTTLDAPPPSISSFLPAAAVDDASSYTILVPSALKFISTFLSSLFSMTTESCIRAASSMLSNSMVASSFESPTFFRSCNNGFLLILTKCLPFGFTHTPLYPGTRIHPLLSFPSLIPLLADDFFFFEVCPTVGTPPPNEVSLPDVIPVAASEPQDRSWCVLAWLVPQSILHLRHNQVPGGACSAEICCRKPCSLAKVRPHRTADL
mmetsp:Transcript_22994/g.28201  ORF Transcript_22994/g.28201 Transcript_22994/m.28201 type:complete len:212 (+) Transcript_22994:1887-2522(+)